jgi:hypothetical protein
MQKSLWCALLWVVAATAGAQMPSTEEMARATSAAEPAARREGITLRIGSLWLAALRERAPMVVAYGRGVCQLGYSAYTPGRDYRWLFPALVPAQREVWLAGLVQHELAHCREQAMLASPPAAPQALTEGADGQRWHEVLADLAFALHVDGNSPQGEAMVRQLADLRASQHAGDPAHDSAAELGCYLRERRTAPSPEVGLASLLQWRERCWQTAAPTPATPAAPATTRR